MRPTLRPAITLWIDGGRVPFGETGPDLPCPVCGHAGWCLVSSCGGWAICPREPAGALRQVRDAGWLHDLVTEGRAIDRGLTFGPSPCRPKNWGFVTRTLRYGLSYRPTALAELGELWGVSRPTVEAFGVGWSVEHDAYAVPVRSPLGQLCGVQYRQRVNGRKLCEGGTSAGLFMPAKVRDSRWLLLCEGASDTAVAHELGFAAVGRWCATSHQPAREFLQRPEARRWPWVFVVADGDWPGIAGAEQQRKCLRGLVPCAVAVPPAWKDLREWHKQGATRADVFGMLASALKRGDK